MACCTSIQHQVAVKSVPDHGLLLSRIILWNHYNVLNINNPNVIIALLLSSSYQVILPRGLECDSVSSAMCGHEIQC